jgi:S-adenosyl-L-methionine hydrolase (adenosine-forming)
VKRAENSRADLLGRYLGTCLPAFVALMWLLGCSQPKDRAAEETRAAAHPAIVFMTDFGTANDAVAICKAVILRIDPGAQIMDITHQVSPFSIEEGARFLAGVSPYYPPRTVFLAVVDPGVGSSRKALVVKSKKGQFFVLPDNGLITPVEDRDGIEGAREITNPAWMIGDKVSSTFHGRDIFSPAAAHLAAGEDWMLAGPEARDLVRLSPKAAVIQKNGIQGEVIALDDPFGNLITNVLGDDFKKLGYALGEQVTVTIGAKSFTVPYAKTFSAVPVGRPLLYIDSRGRVSIALNQGDFATTNRIVPPVVFFIPGKGK